MSNHIHLKAKSETHDLSDILRDFKRFTSKRIIEKIEESNKSRKNWMLRLFMHAAKRQNKKGSYQIWTHENHAIQLYSNAMIEEKINYIHLNTVRSGIVENPDDYLFSSARNYLDMEGLLEIIQITRLWKTIN